MLTHLTISNYALIDSIDIEFNNGLSIITGETGAGKSVILGALSMIMGQRVDNKIIRCRDAKAFVEAQFEISEYNLKSLFGTEDIEYDDNTIIRREIYPNGKSRAFINDMPVSLTQIKKVSDALIDIHSQHQNLLLTDPQYQLNILDSFAPNNQLISEYRVHYNEYKALEKSIKELKAKYESKLKESDFIKFQLEQLKEASLLDGELEELEIEQKTLSNASEIKECLYTISEQLSENDTNIISSLSATIKNIQQLSRWYDKAEDITNRAESLFVELKDIGDEIVGMQDKIAVDPQRLDYVNDRLDSLYSLMHKHNVDTVEQLIQIRDTLEEEVNDFANSDEHIVELQSQCDNEYKIMSKLAEELTVQRTKIADEFKKSLIETASPLGMRNISFEVDITKTNFNNWGADNVSFLFAFNKNQRPLPVANTASGGEISRLMLCIKSLISVSMKLPVIVFDEIDTGVSGEIADKMGNMMRDIGQGMQVISITHLPQVAAKGKYHYKVYKEDTNDSTNTYIKLLSKEERVEEIAHMLSGADINVAAIENAKALLNS